MSYQIDIQHASEEPPPFSDLKLQHWAKLTLQHNQLTSAELTIRLVGEEEMIFLNSTYRKQTKVTNVLAFPAHLPEEIQLEIPLLGDIIICPPVLLKESNTQHIPLEAHWAHITIHGVLHLLGFDHIDDKDAEIMQSHEITLLKILGFSNPYGGEA